MSHLNLLSDPEEYARKAIRIITQQLQTAKSTSRVAKLTSKLHEWQKVLQILGEKDDSIE